MPVYHWMFHVVKQFSSASFENHFICDYSIYGDNTNQQMCLFLAYFPFCFLVQDNKPLWDYFPTENFHKCHTLSRFWKPPFHHTTSCLKDEDKKMWYESTFLQVHGIRKITLFTISHVIQRIYSMNLRILSHKMWPRRDTRAHMVWVSGFILLQVSPTSM